MKEQIKKDKLVQTVVNAIYSQAYKGFAEYGTTLSKAGLSMVQLAEMALQESVDNVFYTAQLLELAREMEQSGENTSTLSKSPLPPFSNAKELTTDKGSGQEAYNLLAASLLSQHRPFEAHEIRRTWITLHQLEDGATLCAIIKNAIETAQGIEAMKPDGDPVEKLKTIQYVGKGNPDILEMVFKICGHNAKFVDVTGKAEFREANRKAGTGEPE